jgi:hypothetical protein
MQIYVKNPEIGEVIKDWIHIILCVKAKNTFTNGILECFRILAGRGYTILYKTNRTNWYKGRIPYACVRETLH